MAGEGAEGQVTWGPSLSLNHSPLYCKDFVTIEICFFLEVLGLELRDLHLLGRYHLSHFTSPVLC
jgi:hypothetical protein